MAAARRIVVLDAGPLSLVTHPKGGPDAEAAKEWLRGLREAGVDVRVPEIADYELRRELVRAGKARSVERLNRLAETPAYLPLTTEAMRMAAEYWARVRLAGQPTAPAEALDGDAILAAQAALLDRKDEGAAGVVVIATTNVGHLSRFPVAAEEWSAIVPAEEGS